MPKLPPVTQAFLFSCVGVYLASTFLMPQGALGIMALWPIGSGAFRPWQLVTYALLHADMLHLFFNMLGLWTFGTQLEIAWGRERYISLVFVSVLSAAAAQLAFSLLTRAAGPTIGASGALFGLLFGYAKMFPERAMMPMFLPIPIKAKYYVVLFGALELLSGLNGSRGVAHFAHLGGMLGASILFSRWVSEGSFGAGGIRTFVCPRCDATIRAPANAPDSARRFRCPGCRHEVVRPD